MEPSEPDVDPLGETDTGTDSDTDTDTDTDEDTDDGQSVTGADAAAGEDPAFEALLVYLREQRNFDFTGYKRPSLVRRVNRRMAEVGIQSFAEYQDHLQVHPEEFAPLFNTILINVTGFFRDRGSWDHLRDRLLPELLASAGPDIRVWSAGCASGQEAFSLAMLLS